MWTHTSFSICITHTCALNTHSGSQMNFKDLHKFLQNHTGYICILQAYLHLFSAAQTQCPNWHLPTLWLTLFAILSSHIAAANKSPRLARPKLKHAVLQSFLSTGQKTKRNTAGKEKERKKYGGNEHNTSFSEIHCKCIFSPLLYNTHRQKSTDYSYSSHAKFHLEHAELLWKTWEELMNKNMQQFLSPYCELRFGNKSAWKKPRLQSL